MSRVSSHFLSGRIVVSTTRQSSDSLITWNNTETLWWRPECQTKSFLYALAGREKKTGKKNMRCATFQFSKKAVKSSNSALISKYSYRGIWRSKIVMYVTICVNSYFSENSTEFDKKCLPKTEKDQIFRHSSLGKKTEPD